MKPRPSRSFSLPSLSRRRFLQRIAHLGAGAVLGSMFALDLLADDRRFKLQLDGRAPENRRRVIILGGGVAGLSCAYELGRIGYACTILEARARPGGRCWTIRRDTEETELGGPPQVCAFDPGQFYNPGPMRIPHHHTTTLGYCREFGIPLTVFTNFNEAGYSVRQGFPKMRLREVIADIQGYTAELLAKVVRSEQLDAPLSADDRERLIEYLRAEGRLDATLAYPHPGQSLDAYASLAGTRGYTRSPGAVGGTGDPTVPLDLEALLKAGYARDLGFLQDYDQQPTMLTPVGGMDRIAAGFAQRLGDVVRYRSEVREVRRTATGGVRVAYADGNQGGDQREIEGDFCIAALPPHLLARIPSDFSPAVVTALRGGQPFRAAKIGLQFKRRFWEEDDDIYSGCSKTDDPIGQIYYPFDNFGTRGPGVVIGYYNFGGAAQWFDEHLPAEREQAALEQGARIHPQYPDEFQNSFSVSWWRIPYNEGAWVRWNSGSSFDDAQPVLRAADGPFVFAGDWASDLVAWQAGAFVSAQRACMVLHERAKLS